MIEEELEKMKKHFRVLEYVIIAILFLYGIVYLLSHGRGNYIQDDIEFGFYLVRVSLGHGFALMTISYAALRFGKRWIPLILTIINGIVSCMIIGFSSFDLIAEIFGNDFSIKYIFPNTLIRYGNIRKDAKSPTFNDMSSITKCNLAEVLCVILQVTMVIAVLYSLVMLILMFTKYAKKEIEEREEFKKSKYKYSLRIVNILLGVIFIAFMIYIVNDLYSTQSSKEVRFDSMVNVFSAYLIPTIVLFIISDKWIKRGENIKLIAFYLIYAYWAYWGIADFLVRTDYVVLAWIYVGLVSITAMIVFINGIYSVHRKKKDLEYEKAF